MCEIITSQNISFFVSDVDYDKVNQYKWHVKNCRTNWYICRTTGKNRNGIMYLHRYITNCPDGKEVNHIDGDSLNNTRENLEIISKSDNVKDMHKRKNNK